MIHTLQEERAVAADSLSGVRLGDRGTIGSGVDSRVLSLESTLGRHFASELVVGGVRIERR